MVGRDDEETFRYFVWLHGGATVTFGLSPEADVRAADASHGPAGSAFTLHAPGWSPRPVRLPLLGPHNVLNALAAPPMLEREELVNQEED